MVYEPGQEVFRSRFFSHIIEPEFRARVCDFCLDMKGDDNSTMRCSGCKFVYYCQKSCQKSAWRQNHHRKECPVFAKMSSEFEKSPMKPVLKMSDLDNFIFHVVRIIVKLNNGGSEEFEILPDGRKRTFHDLMSHREDIFKNDLTKNCFKVIYSIIKTCLKEKEVPEESYFQEIYGKIKVNAIGLERFFQNKFVDYATGLFLGASGIDHSW